MNKNEEKKPLPVWSGRAHRTAIGVLGIVMALCVLGLIIVYFVPGGRDLLGGRIIFWLESFAIWAFGISWFVKGEALKPLND